MWIFETILGGIISYFAGFAITFGLGLLVIWIVTKFKE